MANLQTKTPPCLLLGDREWTCSLVSHQGYEITTFLALGDIADEPRMVTERETKLDIQPENESLVHRPVRLSVAASLAPDWRNTPQRLAGLTRRMGTPMCGIWNNIFLLTNPDMGEKSCFMYSEETGNRSASGPIMPKVKHSHPVHP